LFLTVSFVLCLATALFFPLTSARYAGILFIAFVAAWWIGDARPRSRRSDAVVTSLLLVNAVTGLFALERDLHLPFSSSTKVVELAGLIPSGGPIVADYNSLESVSAYLDRPVYSLHQGAFTSFSKFDRTLDPNRSYADGLERFFAGGAREAFLFCPRSLDDGRVSDAAFRDRFQAALLAKCDGAIEPGSDLYLYRVSRRAPPTN
jgi:hypothetical protein